MEARSIFVTWPMEAEARAILERVGTVPTSHTEHELPASELARQVADVQAIIPMGARAIPEAVLAAASRLRIVAVAAVGYNIVDVAAATRRGILVTNTPGVLTETTADMARALMLGVARRVPESDRFVRAGKWRLENVALTPHIGSAPRAARLKMATRAAENCVAALEGHRPPNLVNPEAWRPA